MISVDGLSIDTRVSDVSFAVGPGEWACVIGPNGAGKTTLLRAMCGLVGFTGTVSISGDISTMNPRDIAAVVSYCPQDALIPPHMNVLQYVLLGRASHIGLLGLPSKDDHAIARESLEQVDAATLADRTLSTLSGGEKRRVTIAQALAQRTPVMLLDEPVASLDIGHQQQLLELLDSLRKSGLTLVTTAHDLTLAGLYADRLLLMDGGRVVASGSAAEVLTPELLSTHYGASVSVDVTADGKVSVTPTRSTS